jgi:hypothetical protein
VTDAELEEIRRHVLNDESFMRQWRPHSSFSQAEKDRAALLEEVDRLWAACESQGELLKAGNTELSKLESENERLRGLLGEARPYVKGLLTNSSREYEVKTVLLARIDAALEGRP